MSALYESNPNATYNDWKNVGKKHGITSAIDLANAWASARANKTKQKDHKNNLNLIQFSGRNLDFVVDLQIDFY